MMSNNIAEWPKELEWVVDELADTTFQRFTETMTDSGHISRRPTSSKMPAFSGTVEMGDQDWEKLSALHKSDFIFKLSSTPKGRAGLVTFTKPPFERRISMSTNTPTVRTVEIELALLKKGA